jgi:hypothetical protein
MLRTGDNLLLRVPRDTAQPILQLGTVVGVEDNVLTTEFEVEEMAAAAGEDVLIYFQHDGAFLQQLARIGTIERAAPGPSLGIETQGEPRSAEKRQEQRYATVASELMAELGDDGEPCPLLDISQTGLAVMSSTTFHVSDVIPVTLVHGDARFAGRASVQSARELWEGRFRYGLCCLDSGADGDQLREGTSTIIAAISV